MLDFRNGSPQYVAMQSTPAGILPDRAQEADSRLSTATTLRIGIFADEMPQNIITRVVNYQLDAVLLCGNESPTLIRNLRTTLVPDIQPHLQFWRPKENDEYSAARFAGCIDRFIDFSN